MASPLFQPMRHATSKILTIFGILALLGCAGNADPPDNTYTGPVADDPDKPGSPSESSSAAAPGLADDPFWSQPVRYADFILLRLGEEAKEHADYINSSKRNGPFVPASGLVQADPKVISFVNQTTGRAKLRIEIIAVDKLLTSAEKVCALFFDDISFRIGAEMNERMAVNSIWSRLPPSASMIPPPSRSAAAKRFIAQLDLEMVILETTDVRKGARTYVCSRPLDSEKIDVSVTEHEGGAGFR